MGRMSYCYGSEWKNIHRYGSSWKSKKTTSSRFKDFLDIQAGSRGVFIMTSYIELYKFKVASIEKECFVSSMVPDQMKIRYVTFCTSRTA